MISRLRFYVKSRKLTLEENRIGIEYMYAFVGKTTNEALVILRVEEPEIAVEVLTANHITVLPSNLVYNL